MSIVGAGAGEPPWWVWAVWLVAAIVMAGVFARRTRRGPDALPPGCGFDVPGQPPVERTDPTEERKARRLVPLLAMTAFASFFVWIGTQVVYVSIRQPSNASTQPAGGLPATDLAQLGLIAGLAGWSAAFAMLAYGRGLQDIGYGLRRIPNGLLAGTIGVFIALPMVFYMLQASEWVLKRFHVEHPKQHKLLTVIENDPTSWVRTLAILSAVVAAPLFEEILFRGCLQGGLRRATRSPLIGIAVASILFVSLHDAWTMPPLFVFSVLLGITYERTGNLWATTVMHALFNTFSIVVSGMN